MLALPRTKIPRGRGARDQNPSGQFQPSEQSPLASRLKSNLGFIKDLIKYKNFLFVHGG